MMNMTAEVGDTLGAHAADDPGKNWTCEQNADRPHGGVEADDPGGDVLHFHEDGQQLEGKAQRNIATGYCCNCCNKIAIAPGCGSGCGHGALPRVNGFHWL